MNATDTEIMQRIADHERVCRLERAAQWMPEMIVALQDAVMTQHVNNLIAEGTPYHTAKITARQRFDVWEHNSLNSFGRRPIAKGDDPFDPRRELELDELQHTGTVPGKK